MTTSVDLAREITHDGRMRMGWVFVLVSVACGDNATRPPDAAVDAAAPDASPCAAPTQACGTSCVDLATDEDHCGGCGITCGGGAVCRGACTCPPAFVPATIAPGQFDQFRVMGPITVAIGPTFDGGINPVLVGYTTTTPLDTDLDLSTIPLGELPFVGAGFDVDLSTLMPDASYVVTAGTLRLTRACATEVEGTLTGASFQGVTGGIMTPTLDPTGCVFTVASLAFHVMTTPCP